jgi:hypothetical protein
MSIHNEKIAQPSVVTRGSYMLTDLQAHQGAPQACVCRTMIPPAMQEPR